MTRFLRFIRIRLSVVAVLSFHSGALVPVAAQGVTVGQRVRVTAPAPGVTMRLGTTHGQERGKLVKLTADSVVIAESCYMVTCSDVLQAGQGTRYALRNLSSLEYRAGTRADRGLLIGFVAGTVTAAALAVFSPLSEITKPQQFGIGMIAFALPGSAIGLAIGATRTAWISVPLPRGR